MRLSLLITSAILILLLSNAGHAEIYKWVDAAGNIHYGDAQPLDSESEEVPVGDPDATDAPAIQLAAPRPKPVAPPESVAIAMATPLGPCGEARQRLNLSHAMEAPSDAIRAARNNVLRACNDPAAVAAEVRN